MSDVGLFFLLMFGVPIVLLLATFVARDMDRRGLDGRVYGALTFFVPPVGLALWMYQRAKFPTTPTSS